MRNMLEYLERSARRHPDRVAFHDDRDALTFSALLAAARRIGSRLAQCARPRQSVALLLDPRSIRNIPALFGVLCAGCAYAPLDIAMPQERLAELLRLLAPGAVIADEKGAAATRDILPADAALIPYDEAAAAEELPEVLAAIREQTRPEDPMSILYTSGSTGIPKGSVQTHAGYIAWTEATIPIYGLTEDTVFGNQSPFFYANSVFDIATPVALSARVYLLPAGVLTFPRRLIQCLREQRVSALCMTPSSFIGVANAGVLEPGCLPDLRWGVMSGESMPWAPLETWMRATPNAAWWHYYGSTEMFSVAVGKVGPEYAREARLPVGRIFPSVAVRFVGEDGEPVPAGEPGEMLVSSPWVSRGYHRDPARTAASWIERDGRTWYRSGDIGQLRADGQLTVLGRRDSQIKHRGYRMELGDVENALRGMPAVRESCVLHDREQDRIWCFIEGDTDEKALRRALREKLPGYMIPDRIVCLARMPHNASMKVDRAALRALMEQG